MQIWVDCNEFQQQMKKKAFEKSIKHILLDMEWQFPVWIPIEKERERNTIYQYGNQREIFQKMYKIEDAINPRGVLSIINNTKMHAVEWSGDWQWKGQKIRNDFQVDKKNIDALEIAETWTFHNE